MSVLNRRVSRASGSCRPRRLHWRRQQRRQPHLTAMPRPSPAHPLATTRSPRRASTARSRTPAERRARARTRAPLDASEAGPGEAGVTPADGGSDAADGGESTSGLILYYPFDDGSGTTATDTSGFAHNGTAREPRRLGGPRTPGPPAVGTTAPSSSRARRTSSCPRECSRRVTDMTIGVWVKLQSIAPWARVFDFGNGPLGTGNHWTFLTPQRSQWRRMGHVRRN